MKQWLYKWLPIICGCHCRPDRSFFYNGQQFPVCARCTGFLSGFLPGLIAFAFYHLSSVPVLILMLVPMIIDGTVQKRTSYESTNFRRFVTGLLFGYAVVTLFLMMIVFFHMLGRKIGIYLFQ